MTRAGQLVVSIHDVSPPERARVEQVMARLAGIGVRRFSLLVIPNLRDRWPIDADQAFCNWLRQRQDRGDEVVLHGWEHAAVGTPRALGDRLRNRWYTQGEGEFLSLEYDEASRRISLGLSMLMRAGLRTDGFVAPSWLVSPDSLRAAADIGLRYTNSYLRLVDLERGQSHVAPSLVFGPGHLDEDLGIALQRPLSRLIRRLSLVRVVVHPPCGDDRRRFDAILAMVERLLPGHDPVTYGEALERLRETTPVAPERDCAW